ncbi:MULTISPECIES: LPS export ABC transporter ATP-binding protein [Marichromatium]|uniref:Lipopolysaccharide export system ATP-binding protein LptB n=1 Tax=Marichromatium gracile TaxID=1048 RepID=A0A4R4ACS4_MARGR|nr:MULTISPECIES: LPS export ABC transporter ATP-binding protein [Marichromatium]MBO8084513.1 LPS export ABC transporter ATP-binding protein [Marichromatium sp.]MBK1708994.1 LPS export ABC transporter ATP-binding protein [Marichromatium gracile]RNE91646.1 LPS export ABC transporter ATP-binding protein [Marichromatium sp. AB31]RNE93409.1 LPS export ABC transporter ATP-binding protein [Marichromatium sp. AB32]TCW36878.1 lipopolysaccharide export system ATP-binding protein [Marichromatium gracile]
MSVLRAEQLKKRYRSREVLRGVSVEVEAGEVVGLLGPNGAGKTTCFYLIVGLIPADQGRITLDEHDVTLMPMHARARAGLSYLAQEPSVFRKLSARDNILAILETRGDLDREQREQRCEQLLEELGIAHIGESLALSLSGGERRRLEIARALAVDPKVMLLDEPFAGVDPIAVGDIKAIVSHLRERGIGVLITDHNVRETLDICDRGYIISNGEVIAAGRPDELLANQQVRDVYLGADFAM